MSKIILLDFVHNLNYKIIRLQSFEAGFCFRLQVNTGKWIVNPLDPLCLSWPQTRPDLI
jgi:hypothetical protein